MEVVVGVVGGEEPKVEPCARSGAQQCLTTACLQLALRFSFQPQLRPSVDMTSNVKGGPQIS